MADAKSMKATTRATPGSSFGPAGLADMDMAPVDDPIGNQYMRSMARFITAWIKACHDFGGVDVCLYTALRANIEHLTASRLAELAIDSATRPAGAQKRDGISYLMAQKGRGITTPLMPAYEVEILAQSKATDLLDAWQRARGQGCGS